MRKDSNNGEGPQGNKDDFEYRVRQEGAREER